jgi:hypothetical protein
MMRLTFKAVAALLLLTFTGKAQQWNGLTYYSNMGSSTGYLIDTASTVVKTYTYTGGGTAYSTYFMPGGNFVRSVQNPGNVLTGGGMSGRLQKLDYNGNLLWQWTYSSSTYCTHHDHCVMPNGNILVICYDVKSQTDLQNAGCTANLSSIRSEKIMELQPVGSNSAIVVWEWSLWDHLVQNVDQNKANYQTSIVNHPELVNINYQPISDWIHMNGIDYNPILDQIVVSSHNLSEWWVIDHSTTTAQAATHTGGIAGKGGDLLYRWGNPLAYQGGIAKTLNVTHDAHWVPEGSPNAGYLTGINNAGVTSPSNKTTVDQIPPPRSDYNYTVNLGSAYTPTTYANRYLTTGYTSNMGSVEEYPNGNRMICLATSGNIFEIDAAGNVLWTKTTGGSCPQSHRYTPCYLNNAAPAQPSISVSGNDLVSTSATTYQWYLNGNLIGGATSQSYTPSQNGMYVVRTTDSNGCIYVYSPGYNYNSIPTSLKNISAELINAAVFPNPASGVLNVRMNLNEDFEVNIRTSAGQLIYTGKNVNTIDLSTEAAGIYLVTISTQNSGKVTKKVTLVK